MASSGSMMGMGPNRHNMGHNMGHGPPTAQNIESCSTQSSSSSASGPPEYNACAMGAGPPPSYEQASLKRGYHTHAHKISMGGAPEPPAPKVPPHQGSSRKKSGSSQARAQQGSARHHGHSSNFPMNKPRQAGSNELYYMGEFYG